MWCPSDLAAVDFVPGFFSSTEVHGHQQIKFFKMSLYIATIKITFSHTQFYFLTPLLHAIIASLFV